MPSRPTANWAEIKTLYEQGAVSNRELARRYAPLTEGAIRKRAKKEVWARPDRARIARRGSSVRRVDPRVSRAWQHCESVARRIIRDHLDPTNPGASSAEEMLEVAESAVATLLREYTARIENQRSLIEKLERCAEEHHVPYGDYLKLRRQYELPALGRGIRNIAETLKILDSIRKRTAR